MWPKYITEKSLNLFIESALAEDLGDGDHSSLASIPENAENSAYLLMKDSGIIAGVELAEIIFKKLSPSIKVKSLVKDGDAVKKGDIIMRMEKWAVFIGGGVNHRFGLYDMIMLKDNHNDFAGGITQSVSATKDYLKRTGRNLKIEVETRNLEEVKEVLSLEGVHRIMLDNMSPALMSQALALINGRLETEASGGITESTIGALTHSAKSLDISLKAE